MNHLLKLSAIFALWEIGKIIIGRKRILEAAKDSTMGCLLMIFEIPYAIWGIWPLFVDVNAAIVLWSLTIVSVVMYFVSKELEAKFQPVNCALSALALAAIFMGKL